MGCRVVDTHSNIVHKLEIEPKINFIQDLLYRIRQKIRWIKFSPIARPLYWGKIFAKFNFANRIRSPLQVLVGGARAYRIMRMRIHTHGVPRSMT